MTSEDSGIGDTPRRSTSATGSADLSSGKSACSSLVTARGTSEGLILRLDSRVERAQLLDAVREFLATRKEFLSGNEVELEWVGAAPPTRFVAEVADLLEREFKIRPKIFNESEDDDLGDSDVDGDSDFDGSEFLGESSESKVSSLPFSSRSDSSSLRRNSDSRDSDSRDSDSSKHHRDSNKRGRGLASESQRSSRIVKGSEEALEENSKTVSLFGGVESISMSQELPHGLASFDGTSGKLDSGEFDSSLWDDPDARIVFSTLRSGQKIETEHSLVVCGDVNSGAEVIAGGDVIILGTLRGVAHAGAYDETGGGRFIFSLDMRPTQLRIGTVISRGSSEGGHAPEIARVEGDLIAVEPYQTKGRALRRQKVGNLS